MNEINGGLETYMTNEEAKAGGGTAENDRGPGEKHRAVTGKMLLVVEKKLDLMDPADLTQGTVAEWVETAIRADREAAGLTVPGGKAEPKQGEINFTPEFEGL
jgi:hypothetical protein